MTPNIGSDRYVLLRPEMSLTNICIVSSASEVVELMLEMLDVRRIVVMCCGWWKGVLKEDGELR